MADEIRLHMDYCLQHDSEGHWLDQFNHCHGDDRSEWELDHPAYYYAGHVRGTVHEFKYISKGEPNHMNAKKAITKAQARADKTGESNALATSKTDAKAQENKKPLAVQIKEAEAARLAAKKDNGKNAAKPNEATFSEAWQREDDKDGECYNAYTADLWELEELSPSGYVALPKMQTLDIRTLSRVTKDGKTVAWQGKVKVEFLGREVKLVIFN